MDAGAAGWQVTAFGKNPFKSLTYHTRIYFYNFIGTSNSRKKSLWDVIPAWCPYEVAFSYSMEILHQSERETGST